ncbi:hypothetical protein NEIRO02_2337 [Nematocida sp. AWRm79]|nr:hypothetical protein NEIRO02_2337 [Nematocida sp. AWRm79]
MNNKEYAEILQKVVDTLQLKERKNGIERECYLVSLFTRLEILMDKHNKSSKEFTDMSNHIKVIKRLSEIILRGDNPEKVPFLLSIINSPF